MLESVERGLSSSVLALRGYRVGYKQRFFLGDSAYHYERRRGIKRSGIYTIESDVCKYFGGMYTPLCFDYLLVRWRYLLVRWRQCEGCLMSYVR